MTIQEAIKERHMVRKYLEKPIPTEIAAQLQERLTEDNQTSGLRLTLVTGNNDGLGTMAKLISKNVNNYIILAGPDTPALDDNTKDLTSVREYLAVTKASVSQMLSSLEKRGLLVRKIDPTNRRNLIVTLTSEGIERLRQKEFQVERRLRELLAELGETDARQFITLINKMNTVLSKKKEEH